ncbi:hypothetical protein K9N68_35420 (plasmid) [Kovacikia minuta CCNUW1]|uniref:hypothetical protein n=1 Tax=Kovacikia minuta TaxID=2931930 RepID=UPI001CCEAEC4|nr:hypothetical protein [Kovacikia minuta]UBF30481.1 hypothetical protein K9N68_35420 [Kovacikia minuta CCNUW1]
MGIVVAVATGKFCYIQEWEDDFLALFPHRYDYIYAEHPEPGQPPAWQTERRYPLADRILAQGDYLYGVRFGEQTNYCLLDIDIGSSYHPKQDRLAIARILAAIEPLGLVSPVICTSSYSQGLHLYFPFEVPQRCNEIAAAVETVLNRAGFRLLPGQLELFPNSRPYLSKDNPGLLNAHRLPMQAGSYLLNQDLQPIGCYQHQFVQSWKFAQDRNHCVSRKNLRRFVKPFWQRSHRVSGRAEKFMQDLNAEIELGWTGHGQTNRLLGRIAMRTYVFHHILFGGEPLEGQALVQAIVITARSLPGYHEWCRHQHEIETRAEEWARCVENSHYFHFGVGKKGKSETKEKSPASLTEQKPLSWNQQRSQETRERIRQAIAGLLEKNILPASPTARFRMLTSYGIGGASLYRHRDLWHPASISEASPERSEEPVENFSGSKMIPLSIESPIADSIDKSATSLLNGNDSNHPPSKNLQGFPKPTTTAVAGNCSNNRDGGSSASGNLPNNLLSYSSIPPELLKGIGYVKQVLITIEQWRKRDREVGKHAKTEVERCRQEANRVAYIDRMRQYWVSGDPILMNEAKQVALFNPEILNSAVSLDMLSQKETGSG